MIFYGQKGDTKDPRMQRFAILAEPRGYRKPIDRGDRRADSISIATRPVRTRGWPRWAFFVASCGTVCPIRSDRYCTPPYNLHRLMTSITLLRALTALRTARVVVRSLGHGLDTRLLAGAEHTRNTQRHAGRHDRRAIYTVAVAMLWICYALRLAYYQRRVQEFGVPSLFYSCSCCTSHFGNRYIHTYDVIIRTIFFECCYNYYYTGCFSRKGTYFMRL